MNLDMKEGNQTAVEWLFEKLWEIPIDKFSWYAVLNKAKEIEKEQIISAACYEPFLGDLPKWEGENYYEDKYGK